MDFAGSTFCHGIERRQTGQPPGELVQPAHRAHTGGSDSACSRTRPANAELITATTRKINKRQQFVRLGNGERVERRDEKEVVDEE